MRRVSCSRAECVCTWTCTGTLVMQRVSRHSMPQCVSKNGFQTTPNASRNHPCTSPELSRIGKSQSQELNKDGVGFVFFLSENWQQLTTLWKLGSQKGSQRLSLPSLYLLPFRSDSELRPRPHPAPDSLLGQGGSLPQFLVSRFRQSFSAFLSDSFDQIFGELCFF